MICPKCGTNNEETYQFCLNCGTPLSGVAPGGDAQSSPSEPTGQTEQPAGSQTGRYERKDLLKDQITPAEGEVSVRTYYCTYYISRLLGLKAWGHLGVTNKRVIFQALGTSNAGTSMIQSELPIADVSGISSYKGTFFSFGHMAFAFVVSGFIAFILLLITAVFGTLSEIGIANLFNDTSRSGLSLGAIGWTLGIGCTIVSVLIARNYIWRSIFAAVSCVGYIVAVGGGLLALLTGGGITNFLVKLLLSSSNSNSTSSVSSRLTEIALFLAFLSIIYTLVCIFWYARRPTFAIAINSKGGSDAPISISGANGWGIFNVSAGKALTAEPAEDAERMLQELGAVILDVQMLGDIGINKWKSL